MSERNYKNLHLDRTNLRQKITDYIIKNNYEWLTDDESKSKWCLEFYHLNKEVCLINIFFNKDGTSSIQYLQGKNREEGKKLADYLYDTINPDEFMTVNMSLKNIPEDEFISVIKELDSEYEDIKISEEEKNKSKLFNVTSCTYNDTIKLTYHQNRTLQIQGKPLTCYKRFIYYISTLLDLPGIESVLMKTDSSRSEILNIDMAKCYLKNELGEDIFDKLDHSIKLLLLSSFCVKYSSPKLSDYCMLLYPEFRALEGILKKKLREHDLIASEYEDITSFSGFFGRKTQSEGFSIKQEYEQKIPCEDIKKKLCDAYEFFNKHRNRLFHMDEYINSSRMISDINEMNKISKILYTHLKNLI